MKKYFSLLILSLLLLSIYGGCTDGGGGNELLCSIEEMQDRFAGTDCIADELVTGCTNILCRSTEDTFISAGNFDVNCEVIDCGTLSCDTIRVSPTIDKPGLMTELAISETNGLPVGLFVVDETESFFDCSFIANQ